MRLKEETYNLRLRVQIPAPGNTRWIFFQHLPTCKIVKYYFKNTDELFSQFGPKRCHVCFANDIYDNWADTVARLLCLSLPWPNEKEGTTLLLSTQYGRQHNGQKKWIELPKNISKHSFRDLIFTQKVKRNSRPSFRRTISCPNSLSGCPEFESR